MRGRLSLISFAIGLLAGDLMYRLSEFSAYQFMLVVALVATAILFALRTAHDLIRNAAFPFVGGFAVSGVFKWVFTTMLF